MKVTEEKIKNYVENDYGNCLGCGSGNIEGDSIDVEGNTTGQRIRCVDCDLTWVDVYTLSDVVDITYPDEEKEK